MSLIDDIKEKIARIKSYKGNIKNKINDFGGAIDSSTPLRIYPDHLASSQADDTIVDSIVDRSLDSLVMDNVTRVADWRFYSAPNLSNVSLGICSEVGFAAFQKCSNINTISFPNLETIEANAFRGCSLRMTELTLPKVTSIGGAAFSNVGVYNNQIGTLNLPVITELGSNALEGCRQGILNMPECVTIQDYAMTDCITMTEISVPKCEYIGYSAFENCRYLSTISLPKCSEIGSYAFYSCYRLSSVYLMGSSVAKLRNYYCFYDTPLSEKINLNNNEYGKIYVRASLLNQYKTSTNWVYYSSRFVGITESGEEDVSELEDQLAALQAQKAQLLLDIEALSNIDADSDYSSIESNINTILGD